MTLVAGDRLSHRYLIEAELGGGGMGCVYRARDVRTGHRVAIKVLCKFAVDGARQRFEREIELMARLDSPGVVRLHDHGDSEHGRFVVMDYVRGADLRDELFMGALPIDVACEIGAQLGMSLHELHHAGIVHRDIKPENVILDADAEGVQTRLIDLGIGIEPDRASLPRITADGRGVGTPHYASPEQLLGRILGPWVDVYALGVVMYEMLTGVLPFDGANIGETVRAVMTGEAMPIQRIRPKVPTEVASLVHQMLSRDVMARPRSALAVATALRESSHGAHATWARSRPPSRDAGSAIPTISQHATTGSLQTSA